MQFIFQTLSSLLFIYTLLCLIRIFLTWFQGAEYSPFGRTLAALCDPYLDVFKRLTFLRFSAFDFSPAVALCVLWAASSICSSLAAGSKLSLGGLVAMLLAMCWRIVNSVLGFLIVLLIIRLVVLLVSKHTGYGTIWDRLDQSMTPLIYRIAAPFARGKPLPFKTALIIAIAMLFLMMIIGTRVIGFLYELLMRFPV